MRILIVEDDKQLLEVLGRGFQEQDFSVHTASTMDDARAALALNQYAVVVLDIMLPGGTGIELCRALRKARSTVPVLMLTARDTVDDRVLGLEAGADDYVVKPFDLRELVARVRALMRRPAAVVPELFQLGGLQVNLTRREVSREGQPIELTAREFDLLECFVRHPGAALSRATLTSYVWDDNHDPFSNALEVLVGRLRRKIDEGFQPKLIHTLRRAGYRFGP